MPTDELRERVRRFVRVQRYGEYGSPDPTPALRLFVRAEIARELEAQAQELIAYTQGKPDILRYVARESGIAATLLKRAAALRK